jgi:hypothetical protein
MSVPESDTILRHLIDRYAGVGPSYVPSTLEARTKSDLICRFHDLYITTIQARHNHDTRRRERAERGLCGDWARPRL